LFDILAVNLHIFNAADYYNFKLILFHICFILADVVIKGNSGIIAVLFGKYIYGSFWSLLNNAVTIWTYSVDMSVDVHKSAGYDIGKNVGYRCGFIVSVYRKISW
jgi:hypothetical protein